MGGVMLGAVVYAISCVVGFLVGRWVQSACKKRQICIRDGRMASCGLNAPPTTPKLQISAKGRGRGCGHE